MWKNKEERENSKRKNKLKSKNMCQLGEISQNLVCDQFCDTH
jgi:hypothetical protein